MGMIRLTIDKHDVNFQNDVLMCPEDFGWDGIHLTDNANGGLSCRFAFESIDVGPVNPFCIEYVRSCDRTVVQEVMVDDFGVSPYPRVHDDVLDTSRKCGVLVGTVRQVVLLSGHHVNECPCVAETGTCEKSLRSGLEDHLLSPILPACHSEHVSVSAVVYHVVVVRDDLQGHDIGYPARVIPHGLWEISDPPHSVGLTCPCIALYGHGSTYAVNIVKQVLVGNDAYRRTAIQQQQLPCVALGVGSVVTRLVMVVVDVVGLEH